MEFGSQKQALVVNTIRAIEALLSSVPESRSDWFDDTLRRCGLSARGFQRH